MFDPQCIGLSNYTDVIGLGAARHSFPHSRLADKKSVKSCDMERSPLNMLSEQASQSEALSLVNGASTSSYSLMSIVALLVYDHGMDMISLETATGDF